MKITKRMSTLASLVPPSKSVADVGTDHAFLPCYLVTEKIAPYVIGIDVKEGPYQIACKNVTSLKLQDRIEIRLGNGLKPLRPGEVQVVIIAGMGGATMVGILQEEPEIVDTLSRIILQPMNGAEIARIWLIKSGWKIVAEHLVAEDGRIFQAFAAEKGEAKKLSKMEACYGPLLIEEKNPLLLQVLEKDIEGLQETLLQLAKSRLSVEKKIKVFEQRLEQMKELYKWLLAAGTSSN